MPETLALLKLSWNRNRLFLIPTIAALATCVAAMILITESEGSSPFLREIALPCTVLPLMAGAFAGLLFFDYGGAGHLTAGQSGCSHWVLRMPIQAWKIALVPISLKTAWVVALWLLIVFVFRYSTLQQPLPLLAPPLYFAAICIGTLALSWRPFKAGWQRPLSVAFLGGPALYLGTGIVLAASRLETRHAEWQSLATFATIAISASLYLAAIWFAVRSAELAKTNTLGIIPAKATAGKRWLETADRERHFGGPTQTIIAHDLLASASWLRKVCLAGVLPTTMVFTLLVPANATTVILALICFGYLAAFSIFRAGGKPSAIAPHIATSPLGNARLAWTRAALSIAVSTIIFLCVTFVFAGWSCIEANRVAWMQWSELRASEIGSTDTMLVGLRWSLAALALSLILIVTRFAACFWCDMSGRAWVSATLITVLFLAFSVSFGVTIRWFLQQSDWESTRASALEHAAWLPAIMSCLLVIKGAGTLGSAVAIYRSQLVSLMMIFQVALGWLSITWLVAAFLAILIPDPRVTFAWCLASTALAIPLARILILPLAFAWNRHR